MIKSLYARIVLTFLASVAAGITIVYFVANGLFTKELNETLQSSATAFSRDLVRIYETLPFDEADALVSQMNQLPFYYVRIYDETGLLRSYLPPNGPPIAAVTPEQVRQVVGGEMYRNVPQSPDQFVIGLPFQTARGTHALFAQPIYPTSSLLAKWILTILAYSFAAGSIFLLIAAPFLVRPLKKLTKATKRLAEGNFDVKLDIKQQDELGTLARSFEDMARELNQLERMRRDFVSNVSHEVQSPLTSISGYAKALQTIDLPDRERKRYLDIIIAESDRVSKMGDKLLKLALLESQPHPLQTAAFKLDEQIRRVIVACQPQWSAKNIRFELDLPAVTLTADQDQISQVWTNLLGNSIKFSPEGGTIAVSIEQGAKDVTVRIADTGIGIAPEDQKRIFERFFKADRSRNRRQSGSGLGLAIVKQIVSLHHGGIRVESEPGKGTTVVVTLPQPPPHA
ncbi:two-component sensor histidine kinase [Paenibacillus elgii]|uniref:histidine kinase n=1 Tax=Paenibacillus elgii TaxID=189691 RepID=A0A2T6G1K8_9BACL|nr:ATP-binding protein [Paenibacillus elgii]PUA38041.1 two-component sensor histidine kinase [Paenibacillus elgii]